MTTENEGVPLECIMRQGIAYNAHLLSELYVEKNFTALLWCISPCTLFDMVKMLSQGGKASKESALEFNHVHFRILYASFLISNAAIHIWNVTPLLVFLSIFSFIVNALSQIFFKCSQFLFFMGQIWDLFTASRKTEFWSN